MTDPIVDRLRALCLILPEAYEQDSWGNASFRVRGKIFALERREDGRAAVWFKPPDGMQAVLVEADPQRFFVPPYLGPKGWAGMRLDRDPDWEEVGRLLRGSYRRIAPKRLAAHPLASAISS